MTRQKLERRPDGSPPSRPVRSFTSITTPDNGRDKYSKCPLVHVIHGPKPPAHKSPKRSSGCAHVADEGIRAGRAQREASKVAAAVAFPLPAVAMDMTHGIGTRRASVASRTSGLGDPFGPVVLQILGSTVPGLSKICSTSQHRTHITSGPTAARSHARWTSVRSIAYGYRPAWSLVMHGLVA
jgi:hypothetical protein